MNKEERNISSIIIFILVIIAIIVGGYFLINKNKTNDNNPTSETTSATTTKKSIKIDSSKNYIYYTNESVLSDEKDITYKDLNINIDSNDAREIQDKFNNQMVEIKKNVTYENDKITEAEVLEYSFTTTSKYLSLTVSNYILGMDDEIKDSSMLYYVFDLSNGSLLSTKDILTKENLSDQQIRSKIRSFLNDDDSVDIDATLNQDYSITFASDGKVLINFLVKSSNKEYYTNIEM